MEFKKTEFLLEGHTYPPDLLIRLGFSIEALDFYAKQKIIKRNGSFYIFEFVGFLFFEEKEFFVCPKYRKNVYEQSMVANFKEIFRLLNADLIYSEDVFYSQTLSETILIDFMKHKYFKEEIIVEEEDWNNVDWEESIEDCNLFQNGHPVILENRIKNSKRSINPITVDMQNSLISLLISKNPALIKKMSLPLSYIRHQKYSVEEMILYFRKKNKETRLFREKRMLSTYLDFLTIKESSFQFLGTKYFHVVWEKICKFIFSDTSSSFKRFFPKPTYSINGKETKLKGHIPDIIAVPDTQNCFVLDAKYYNIQKNLPLTEDITKQLFYEKICQNALPTHTILNGFLFLNEQEEDIRLIGDLNYDVFEQKNISLYSLKDTFVISLFCEQKTLDPKTLLF